MRIRYVGKTSRFNRIYGHLYEARVGHVCHKCSWIRQEERTGAQIEWVPLTWYETESEVFLAERRYIASLRTQLTNLTDGGDGASGFIHTLATRAQMSASHLGVARQPHTSETKHKIGNANRGRSPDAVTRMKMSEARKGKTQSLETKSKKSRSLKGRRLGPLPKTTRDKISLALIGRKRPTFSAEWRANMSAARKRR
jgi:hypothetical protein